MCYQVRLKLRTSSTSPELRELGYISSSQIVSDKTALLSGSIVATMSFSRSSSSAAGTSRLAPKPTVGRTHARVATPMPKACAVTYETDRRINHEHLRPLAPSPTSAARLSRACHRSLQRPGSRTGYPASLKLPEIRGISVFEVVGITDNSPSGHVFEWPCGFESLGSARLFVFSAPATLWMCSFPVSTSQGSRSCSARNCSRS